MEKKQALALIHQQISILDGMKQASTDDEIFKKWRRNTGVIIEKVFGSDGKHIAEYKKISFSPGLYVPDENQQYELNKDSFKSGAVTTKAFLSSLLEEIEQFWEFEDRNNPTLKPQEIIFKMFDKFKNIARQLQSRHDNRPTISIDDEYDVQDLLHALLKLYFDDIRPEEWTPSYAGGSSRMDFLLKKEQIVIEVKKTRDGLKDKQIGEQLIIDKAKYKLHPDCKKLICFVYDPEGRIGNPASLENDLFEKSDTFEVCVVIRPRD